MLLWLFVVNPVVWSQTLPFDPPIQNHALSSHHFILFTADRLIIQDFNRVANGLPRQLSCAQDIDRFQFSIETGNCPQHLSTIPHHSCLVHALPLERDRSCLVRPPHPPPRKERVFQGNLLYEEMYDFVIDAIGFSLQSANISVSHYAITPSALCDRINYSELTPEIFLSKYWLLQKPLVIEKFFQPKERVELEEIVQTHKNVRVGAKLSFGNEFEGVDEISNWEMSQVQFIPRNILEQLESPNLAVVRPVHKEMSLGEFLNGIQAKFDDLSNGIRKEKTSTLTDYQFPNLYIEYLPLNDLEILKMVKQFIDIHSGSDFLSMLSAKFPLLKYLLNGNAYLWMGDGRAIGKLHFDPFDNILMQVRSSNNSQHYSF
jgi:hypothetical protein